MKTALFVLALSATLSAQRFVPGKYLSKVASAATVTVVDNYLKWHIRSHDAANNPIVIEFYWGFNGDVVLPAADYDGDGIDDPAVYRPWTHEWFVLKSTCRWTCYDSFVLDDVAGGQCPAGTHPQLSGNNAVCELD
jgi:hypothetical protein